MIPSLETQHKIATLREKCANGTATMAEMQEGIAFLRQERLAMPPSKSSSTKKATINADDLLSDLGI